MFKKMKVVK